MSKSFSCCLALLGAFPCVALATHNHAADDDHELPTVTVGDARTPSVAEKYQLPVTTESVTREQIADTINLINTEDALKYLPSVMLRKRHAGDTQAPMTTRTSGPGQSARSLVYADGVLLSALIGNNNSNAAPRWGMVAPEEIERVDVMYGPFSAAYAGNSVGAVAVITTRMPKGFEATAKATAAVQDFSLYGTRDTYRSEQASATLGNRNGELAWFLSLNHLDSATHPVSIATVARPVAPSAVGTVVSGAYADRDRSGNPIFVIGAGGLEHKQQDNFKAKLAYDVTPGVNVSYSLGLFRNEVRSDLQSYLRNAAGGTVTSGSVNIGGYNFTNIDSTLASGAYRFDESHVMHSIAATARGDNGWNWEAAASVYDYATSRQRNPATATAALNGGPGTITSMQGTGWNTADLKVVRRADATRTHTLSFGVHHDAYRLVNPKYNTSNWLTGGMDSLASDSRGRTQTHALWAQDVWTLAPDLRATLGGRYERWRAYDGASYSATPALNVQQPELERSAFSPKVSLAWDASDTLLATASLGKAYRFPTVTELYQSVTTGATLSVPNPDLKPERAWSGELALERHTAGTHVRVSYFREQLADALISYRAPLAGTLASYVQNVDAVRSQGLELSARAEDVLVKGLELGGSITYVDSTIRAASGFYNGATAVDVVGKRTPNIPAWRATLTATWRPDDKLAATVAGRYSDRLWSTLDNSDYNTHTYQGFERYFVVDTRIAYKFDRQLTGAVGVDNLNNRKYFLFHPFPQRTLVAEVRVAF